ncbi:MAG TPA: pitrilysin family protein, partial [Blastocatellia bacterium]|nr:pitrilysin family protein [Blastocatellia bacterium]
MRSILHHGTEFLEVVEPAERYDGVVRFSLDNGMRALLRPASGVPIVSTYIWYRVGSRLDVEGKTGMAHLLEHMTFKGTTAFPDTSIASEVMRNGGAFDAFTGRDYTAFYETLPASHLDLALRIERDRMINAQIADEAFASELGVVVSELEECENDPEWLLSEAVLATAFRVHPYRFPTIGRRSDLYNIGRNDLIAHYKTHYHPQNAVLAIAGDFNIDAAIRRIDQLFSPIRTDALASERSPREPRQEQERRVALERPGAAQSFHCVYRGCDSGNPDVFALLVLTSLLSGVSAFGDLTLRRSGRLYRAFIEPKLAALVTAHYQPARDPG